MSLIFNILRDSRITSLSSCFSQLQADAAVPENQVRDQITVPPERAYTIYCTSLLYCTNKLYSRKVLPYYDILLSLILHGVCLWKKRKQGQNPIKGQFFDHHFSNETIMRYLRGSSTLWPRF